MLMFRPISLIIYVFVSTSPNFFHGICQVDISSTRIFEDSNTPEVTNRAHENHRTSLGGELNHPIGIVGPSANGDLRHQKGHLTHQKTSPKMGFNCQELVGIVVGNGIPSVF